MLIRYVYFTFPYTIYTIVSQFMLLVSYLIEPQAACQICPSDENFVQMLNTEEMLDNLTLDVAALVILFTGKFHLMLKLTNMKQLVSTCILPSYELDKPSN